MKIYLTGIFFKKLKCINENQKDIIFQKKNPFPTKKLLVRFLSSYSYVFKKGCLIWNFPERNRDKAVPQRLHQSLAVELSAGDNFSVSHSMKPKSCEISIWWQRTKNYYYGFSSWILSLQTLYQDLNYVLRKIDNTLFQQVSFFG